MKTQKTQPEKIDSLVWKVLRSKGYETAVLEQMVLFEWEKIAGKKIAEQTVPVNIEKQCLFVGVSNAAWRNELTFLKPEIIRKINDFAGKKIVKDIIFTTKR